MITIEDFKKIDMRVGTIVKVELNKKAKKKAYKMEVDFGKELGIKTTSAQITKLYKEEELIGKQVIAVVNFPALQVANVKSEILILGIETKDGVVLLNTEREVENGLKIS